jgi:hypothetical protein
MTTPASKASTVFIDEIDDDSARLLLDERTFTVPRALLPDGAHEGQWLLFSVTPTSAPPGDDTAARRNRLGADDPGGKITL